VERKESKTTRKPSPRKVVSPKRLSDAPTKEKKERKRRKRTKMVKIERPTYLEMISEAIRHLRKQEGNANNRKELNILGSSLVAIEKYILANFDIDLSAEAFRRQLRLRLKKATDNAAIWR
jgi:hypothetical protein